MSNRAFARLDRIVRRMALTIACLIALVLPLGAGILGYLDLIELRTYEAAHAAEQIGRYAHVEGPNWLLRRNRVADMIRPLIRRGKPALRRVLDPSGGQVVSVGEPQARPSVDVIVPILAGGETVGSVVVVASLLPLLGRIALLVVVGIVLGAIAYAVLHFVPMRALRQSMQSLRATEDALHVQIGKTETALATAVAERGHAQYASRAKSDFLANMSHELRTPLNAIIGFADIMRQEMLGPLDARYRGYAEDIRNSGRFFLAIISDILDLAKIEAGETKLNLGPVDIEALVAATMRLVDDRARRGNVETRVEFHAARSLQATVDELRTKKILFDILANAIKYTLPGGSVTVAVRTIESGTRALRRAEHGMVEIEIRDTGVGMSAEDLENAFEPFQQFGNPLNGGTQGAGLGLGLPLAKRLTEMQGGTLAMTSRPGAGTTVTIRLPMNQPASFDSHALD